MITNIETADSFIYLWHNIKLNNKNQEAEISQRFQQGRVAKIYNLCVISALNYEMETSTFMQKIITKIGRAPTAMERTILEMRLKDIKKTKWIRG